MSRINAHFCMHHIDLQTLYNRYHCKTTVQVKSMSGTGCSWEYVAYNIASIKQLVPIYRNGPRLFVFQSYSVGYSLRYWFSAVLTFCCGQTGFNWGTVRYCLRQRAFSLRLLRTEMHKFTLLAHLSSKCFEPICFISNNKQCFT